MRKLSLVILCFAMLFCSAFADGGDSVYTLVDGEGKVLTHLAADVESGDEYIDGSNRLYRVISIDEEKKEALAEQSGEESGTALTAADILRLANEKRIGIYVTHSDESYEDGDGTSSMDQGWAGIHDVASALSDALSNLGTDVRFDPAAHLPHDAGAYRRSRSTAAQLLRSAPSALLDIHRDGIPDASEYETEVNGEQMTMVRLLVGRSNPNSAANREFAKKIKAAADSAYPGLIKDIFIGKGNYNQELLPRSVLLEFGTHTSDKEQVLRSVEPMAQVLHTVLFGAADRSGNAEQEDKQSTGSATGVGSDGENNVTGTQQGADAESGGAWQGIKWIVALAILGVIGFSILSSGKVSGLGSRLKRFSSELTGGAIGKEPDEEDPDKR